MRDDSAKKVTVLFGAGSGAELWLRRWRDNSKKYLIVDNDSNLWGSERYGVRVAAPASIRDCEYDKVIVLFSHVREARAQLLALGVQERDIEVPAKPIFRPQPFQSATQRRAALVALRKVLRCLADVRVQPVVEQGAALGLYRDGDLIEWDNDIDIGIAWDQTLSLSVRRIRGILQRVEASEVCAEEHDSGLLMTWLHGRDFIPFSLYSRCERDGLAVASDNHFTSVTMSSWWPPRPHRVGGFVFPLPAKTEQYLCQIYGSDWRTPRPTFSFEDYPQM